MMINTCPICGYEGEFWEVCPADEWHPATEYECPQCHSHGRHRMIWVIYNMMKDMIKRNGTMLHCAPEKCLKDKFINDFNYISTDFPAIRDTNVIAKADLVRDLRNTYFNDNWFDITICSAVLDQIKEVDQAIQELYRITAPGGYVVIEVPLCEKNSVLLIEPSWDKWWRCGEDFFDKYVDVGFDIIIYKHNQLRDWERYGITQDTIVVCHKKGEVENDKQ